MCIRDRNTAGVKDATVNFMTLKMSVEFEEGQDAKAVMQEVLKLSLIHIFTEDSTFLKPS